MCQAFSCIIDHGGKVTWKFGIDSHSELARIGGYKDRQLGEFAKIEITPRNRDYINPDVWDYRVDESPAPDWCGIHEKEKCLRVHKQWLKKLDKVIVRKKIVHPFQITPSEITDRHIALLKKWASVGASVGDSVWASVRASVGASVGDSVWASVGDSVWASVRDSVRASVWASVRAYTGSFFKIAQWQYIKHPKGKYPYQPLVQLWNKGLVPSFDGKTWRLHGGEKAKILFSIPADELKTWKAKRSS